MPFSEKLGKVPLQCSLLPCNFHSSWEKLLPKSHPSLSFLCTHFCPPSASTPRCLDLHYPPVVLHLCHSICPHTSFQTGFCYFLLFIFFFSCSLQLLFPTHSCPLHPCHTWPWALTALRARGGCSRYPQPFRSISTGHKAVCKPNHPSRVPRGLQLVETPWGCHGSLVEARQHF